MGNFLYRDEWGRVVKRYWVRLNEAKSIRVDFVLRPLSYHVISIGNELVPLVDYARYLSIHLDSKLTNVNISKD